MIRGAPATGPPLFLSPEKEGEANMHEYFMYPGTDNAKPHESRIHPKMDDANTRHSFSTENVCGAYSIRPYTGTKTVRAGLRRSFSTENVCGAYSICPYTGTKMVRAGWHIPDSFHYSTFAL